MVLTRGQKRRLEQESENSSKRSKTVEPPHIGYKKCGPYVVELEIRGENNEKRTEEIVFPLYAKYRCSKALVRGFWTVDGKKCTNVTEVASNRKSSFIYRLGEEVCVENYDTNVNEICSAGIHYYLDFGAAACHTVHGMESANYTGYYRRRHANGRICFQTRYKKGMVHGKFDGWYDSGRHWMSATYVDGLMCDHVSIAYSNGQIKLLGKYKEGKRNGEWIVLA